MRRGVTHGQTQATFSFSIRILCTSLYDGIDGGCLKHDPKSRAIDKYNLAPCSCREKVIPSYAATKPNTGKHYALLAVKQAWMPGIIEGPAS